MTTGTTRLIQPQNSVLTDIPWGIVSGSFRSDIIGCKQETSKRTPVQLLNFSLQMTKGKENESYRVYINPDYNIINMAIRKVELVKAYELKEYAYKLLRIFNEEFNICSKKYGLDIETIPKISAAIVNDGSISFEWIFSDFRIGFFLGPSKDESSWFLVTNANLGNIGASGYIKENQITIISQWLIEFAVKQQ